jgi:pyruvate/2-oxoglutarate dehydrogenase complex dihydrolipoamide acyltransferase (E2) component
MATKVVLPQTGEGVIEATVMRWLKKEGDAVKEYDPLVEINTDKVDTEIPSPVAGTLLKILVNDGVAAPVNSILAWIGKPGEKIPEDDGTEPKTAAKPPAAKAAPAPQPVSAEPAIKPLPVSPAIQPLPTAAPKPLPLAPATRSSTPQHPSAPATVSPLVARIAAENNVNLANVNGSGTGGRITKEDLLAFINSGGVLPASTGTVSLPKFDGQDMSTFLSPVVKKLVQENNLDVSRIQGTGEGGRVTKSDVEAILASGGQMPVRLAPAAAKPGFPVAFPDAIPGSVMKLNPVRKTIAEHMLRSKTVSPHVTTIMEADMSAVSAHRAANKATYANQSVNLTFTPYFVAAIAAACQAYPIVNSSWSDEGVAIHGQINVGFATALDPDGLIVPVIKNAGALQLMDIARAVNDLSARARAKQLKPEEVQGGTITITNHGTSGSLFATPIINQPQCAILGVGMIQKRVVVINDAIAIRPMVYLGLTFDHRILDGAVADYFLGTVKYTLENWV